MNEQALKDRIKTIARSKGIQYNECWKRLILERFLLRLSQSEHGKNFIFKGGFLLAYMLEIGRETIDLDFLLTRTEASVEKIKEALMEVIAIESNDGFSFQYAEINLLEQPHMKYPGYRVQIEAKFGHMKDRIHIDIGIGDVVSPSVRDLNLVQYRDKPLFENQISLLVYPPETIFAEKLETVISKGAINSRMKDYHDLLLLTREPSLLNLNKLDEAIKQTFLHRNTAFELIVFSAQDLKPLNKLWVAHLKKLGIMVEAMNLPGNIQVAINEINELLSKLTFNSSLKEQ